MSTGSPTGQRVAPAASTSPAATVAQSGRLPRHHKVSVIATITRKPNVALGRIKCSSWIWYASSRTGTAASVAPQPGRP